jgi:hypothetical protein
VLRTVFQVSHGNVIISDFEAGSRIPAFRSDANPRTAGRPGRKRVKSFRPLHTKPMAEAWGIERIEKPSENQRTRCAERIVKE